MTARDELLREMTHNHLYMTDERAEELINAFARELLGPPPEAECQCGAPQGDDEDDVVARQYWKHSRVGCPLGA
ncbi:hypothetical protein ACODT3_10745 [Streptomyces sp. 4.24]|uniref:hypothetical protein n=1 Tax=Streptomyces tritrimontium TaxID=3406573 RepID=UPI003BB57A05